jgi:hypothetical protein
MNRHSRNRVRPTVAYVNTLSCQQYLMNYYHHVASSCHLEYRMPQFVMNRYRMPKKQTYSNFSYQLSVFVEPSQPRRQQVQTVMTTSESSKKSLSANDKPNREQRKSSSHAEPDSSSDRGQLESVPAASVTVPGASPSDSSDWDGQQLELPVFVEPAPPRGERLEPTMAAPVIRDEPPSDLGVSDCQQQPDGVQPELSVIVETSEPHRQQLEPAMAAPVIRDEPQSNRSEWDNQQQWVVSCWIN